MLRAWALLGALILLTTLACRPAQAQSQGVGPTPGNTGTSSTPTLEEILTKGLQARLPGEFKFAKKVVTLVDQHKLPKKLVESTFLWARHKKHPFEYFEAALKIQAKRIGLNLDESF